METPIDMSYLSDAVIMLRYFEASGASPPRYLSGKKAQRHARKHHPRIPALGPRPKSWSAADEFSGILTGTPTYVGNIEPLMAEKNKDAKA